MTSNLLQCCTDAGVPIITLNVNDNVSDIGRKILRVVAMFA